MQIYQKFLKENNDMGNNRIVSLDTETTGLKVEDGHRIIELAMVEIIDWKIADSWHSYFNPCRSVDPGALEKHGITYDSLIGEPLFKYKAMDIMRFIGDSALVIHNAPFDLAFLNAELARSSFSIDDDICGISPETNIIIDTCALSRVYHPGQPASLDACLDRYGVDRSMRVKHGALIDATLLANLYINMCCSNCVNIVDMIKE